MEPFLLWGLVALGLLLISMGLYFAFFSSTAARYWAIRKQARLDYENARGTAHMQMLRTARRSALKAARKHAGDLHSARQRLARLDQERGKKLRQILELHIAYTYLDQVRGVGSTLKDRILRTVFPRRLRDLKRAHTVHGVGQEKQWAINHWIREYEARIPALLKGPFPGKNRIIKEYGTEKAALEIRTEELTQRKASLGKWVGQISEAMGPLQGVSVREFVKAIQEPGQPTDKIDRYLRGVFAEWESTPDWFRQVISQEFE
jgi:hypothetical protein